MKTPHAILIGLALIAAALFFREPSVSPAQAGIMGDVHGFQCDKNVMSCSFLQGDKIMHMWLVNGDWKSIVANYR